MGRGQSLITVWSFPTGLDHHVPCMTVRCLGDCYSLTD